MLIELGLKGWTILGYSMVAKKKKKWLPSLTDNGYDWTGGLLKGCQIWEFLEKLAMNGNFCQKIEIITGESHKKIYMHGTIAESQMHLEDPCESSWMRFPSGNRGWIYYNQKG